LLPLNFEETGAGQNPGKQPAKDARTVFYTQMLFFHAVNPNFIAGGKS